MGYGPFLSILNQKPRCHNKKHNVAILYKHQQDIDIFPRGQTSNISIISINKGLVRTAYIWDMKKLNVARIFQVYS